MVNYDEFIFNQAVRQTKTDMIQVGKRLADKGLLVAKGGNYSVRIGENRILLTASGFDKSAINETQISMIDLEGNVLEGLKPALDIRMHLEIYRNMPEIRAVVHSHPPIATGFAMSTYHVEDFMMPEAILDIGGIETTEFAVPTTIEVPQCVGACIRKNPKVRAIVLRGHGVLGLSDKDVLDACYKIEYLEAVCDAVLTTKILGETYQLNDGELTKVNRVLNGERW